MAECGQGQISQRKEHPKLWFLTLAPRQNHLHKLFKIAKSDLILQTSRFYLILGGAQALVFLKTAQML